jgi:hypothetical protein
VRQHPPAAVLLEEAIVEENWPTEQLADERPARWKRVAR